MAFYSTYSDFDNFAIIGFDETQMRRIFGNDPRQRFDYVQNILPVSDRISEKLNVNFRQDLGSKSGNAIPDIQVLSRHNGNLFLSLNAYSSVKDILSNDGEFIPVSYENGEGYIFNVLRLAEDVDGLDKKLCLKNDWGDVENIAFLEEKVGAFAIFKTKFDGYNHLYCRKDFKDAVEKAGLKGITFSPELGARFSMSQGQRSIPH